MTHFKKTLLSFPEIYANPLMSELHEVQTYNDFLNSNYSDKTSEV